MTFHVDQAAFPLGFLSAWWAYKKDTANPRVGWIGGMNLPEIRIFTESFTAGINHFSEQYNIEILISQGYTNSFNDPDLGRSIANLMLNSGTEIIFPVAGKTGTGAYDVIAARDKWAIGVDIDMHESDLWYSKIFISSCIKNFNCAVSQIAYEALQNNFNNETYTGTLENKGVCMAPYHNFDRAIADSIEEEIIAIKEGIISGKINTGWN
jgi:basic membrane protein A